MPNDSGLPIQNSFLDRENYKNFVAVDTVASATTTDIESSDSQYMIVSGTTTITSLVLAEGHRRIVRFSGALTLTHSASLLMPGAVSRTTVAGDVAEFVGEASGVVRCIAYTAASAGPGYGVGSGGTVTQATSKATGVTLSKPSGQITLHNASLAADTTVSFTLTNTFVAAGDILVMNHVSAGTAGSYLLNAQAGAGAATINVRNITAGSLGEAIVIGFAVVKGATT